MDPAPSVIASESVALWSVSAIEKVADRSGAAAGGCMFDGSRRSSQRVVSQSGEGLGEIRRLVIATDRRQPSCPGEPRGTGAGAVAGLATNRPTRRRIDVVSAA